MNFYKFHGSTKILTVTWNFSVKFHLPTINEDDKHTIAYRLRCRNGSNKISKSQNFKKITLNWHTFICLLKRSVSNLEIT